MFPQTYFYKGSIFFTKENIYIYLGVYICTIVDDTKWRITETKWSTLATDELSIQNGGRRRLTLKS